VMVMKKPTLTQRKILETAAGLASHRPRGNSQHGGWSAAYLVCRRNGWTDDRGNITEAGRALLAPAPLKREGSE
jgi:hypothetical protein